MSEPSSGHSEIAAGLVLLASAALALVIANSPLGESYGAVLHASLGGLSVQHWINDGLMALFFLLVGLEIKGEMVEGQLSDWPRRVLPGIAAAGGMIAPALFFVALNWRDPAALRGWAIPTATDIAFALGILALIGARAPASLKIFLTALAILDDLAAIVVIAVFYTAELSPVWLAGAAVLFGAGVALNRFAPVRLWPFLALGLLLWVAVLKSGVHATLAGVLLAMTIPLRVASAGKQEPPLRRLEHSLQPWVAFGVVPIFGFANAGVSLSDFTFSALLNPLTLGVAAGLFVGKQIGVMSFVWLTLKMRWAAPPQGASWLHIYGVAMLCGVGFTMSLFIGLLAFPGAPVLQDMVKVGVLAGSLLSALGGALVLVLAGPAREPVRVGQRRAVPGG